jgi:hypothetical protein
VHADGTPTDKYDLEIAQSDIKIFCDEKRKWFVSNEYEIISIKKKPLIKAAFFNWFPSLRAYWSNMSVMFLKRPRTHLYQSLSQIRRARRYAIHVISACYDRKINLLRRFSDF